MILEETYETLKSDFGLQISNLYISRVVIGPYLSAVALSDGTIGTAGTISGHEGNNVRENRDFSDFTPLKITGRRVMELFETPKQSNLISTLRVAVLNALSSGQMSSGRYRVLEDCDPADLLDTLSGKTITIVGAFQSYIRRFAETGNRLFVLEMNETAISEPFRKYYVPAADFETVIPASDIVIITGLTLVNGTIDGLLGCLSGKSTVVVTGPSSSIIPDVLFRHGVSIIGSTKVTDPDILFQIAGEGGSGYHLFEYCARKICIINEQFRQVK